MTLDNALSSVSVSVLPLDVNKLYKCQGEAEHQTRHTCLALSSRVASELREGGRLFKLQVLPTF